MKCLLCGETAVERVEDRPSAAVVTKWRQAFNIDVAAVFAEHPTLVRYRCPRCRLESFPPELAGPAEMYAGLQQLDWYYRPHRWEHEVALERLSPGVHLLEVGCGVGDFVEKAVREARAEVLGLELNLEAVRVARARGRPVEMRSLEEQVSETPESFDVVCAFQVLEHLADPAGFLVACRAALRPEGRLLLAVPNRESFLRLEPGNLLDQPPHHLSRWSREVFRWLPQAFDLRLETVRREPLAEYDLTYYLQLQLRRLPLGDGLAGAAHRVLKALLRRTRAHRWLVGHTLYVEYSKI